MAYMMGINDYNNQSVEVALQRAILEVDLINSCYVYENIQKRIYSVEDVEYLLSIAKDNIEIRSMLIEYSQTLEKEEMVL